MVGTEHNHAPAFEPRTAPPACFDTYERVCEERDAALTRAEAAERGTTETHHKGYADRAALRLLRAAVEAEADALYRTGEMTFFRKYKSLMGTAVNATAVCDAERSAYWNASKRLRTLLAPAACTAAAPNDVSGWTLGDARCEQRESEATTKARLASFYTDASKDDAARCVEALVRRGVL